MIDVEKIKEIVAVLKEAERIRKEKLGLFPDQTFLLRFIRRPWKETEAHKKMKNIVVSELIKNGINTKNIFIEKLPVKNAGFRPDVTAIANKNMIFFECHYKDSWCRDSPYHTYNKISKIRNLGKVIICREKLGKQRKIDIEKYVKNHRILKHADEVWFLDLEKETIENKVINNYKNIKLIEAFNDVLKYLELKKRIKLSANQGKGFSNSSKGVES